jgi:DNA-binding XRE family transcriptional regulator
MIIAIPVSFGIAVFLTEIAPSWMRGPVATAIELLGLRREEVALLADVSTTVYSRLEKGQDTASSRDAIKRIAEALHLS